MRANVLQNCSRLRQPAPGPGFVYRLSPGNDSDAPGAGSAASRPDPSEREDLPYKIELWDTARNAVEQVLAVTASGSIGYAAFYGATREFPDRYITLRHKASIISRWNGPQH